MGATRLHVLVVDDDPGITGLFADILGGSCDVLIAHDVAAARAAVARRPPDVLLCDYRLDGTTSAAFLAEVAATAPETRRVLVTGSPIGDWRGLAEDGLVVAVLRQPFELADLWRLIHDHER